MLHNPRPTDHLQGPYKWIGNQQISQTEWSTIADNPIQRDTEKRGKAARHLRAFTEAHRRVAFAILPNGMRYKLDGHTRLFVWENGLAENVPDPLLLNADIFLCRDRQAVIDLYETFDSRSAVETAADTLFGVVNEAEIKFASPMMRANRFGSSVKRLYLLTNGYQGAVWSDPKFAYTCVNYFKQELQLFDRTEPKHTDFTNPILMAAIVSFMLDGERATGFWQKYNANHGKKNESGCDAVQGMRNLLGFIREHKRHGNQHDAEMLGRAVNAYEMFRGRDWYAGKSGVPHKKSKTELDRFLAASVRAKEARK